MILFVTIFCTHVCNNMETFLKPRCFYNIKTTLNNLYWSPQKKVILFKDASMLSNTSNMHAKWNDLYNININR